MTGSKLSILQPVQKMGLLVGLECTPTSAGYFRLSPRFLQSIVVIHINKRIFNVLQLLITANP
jgi:hypothetical protein